MCIFGKIVADPPQIVERPKDLKVRVGSIATFYCRVTGDPAPQVHWRKNGKKVSPAHSRIVINSYGGYAMLRIDPIRHQRDDATYECMAENGVGDPVAASANLTVFAGKLNTKKPTKLHVSYITIAPPLAHYIVSLTAAEVSE